MCVCVCVLALSQVAIGAVITSRGDNAVLFAMAKHSQLVEVQEVAMDVLCNLTCHDSIQSLSLLPAQILEAFVEVPNTDESVRNIWIS